MTMKNATATTVGASRPRRFGVRFWLSLDAVLWILLGVLAIVAPLIAGAIVARTGDIYAGLWYTWGVVAFGLLVAWCGIPGGPPRDFADE